MRPLKLTHRIAWTTHADPLTPGWWHHCHNPKTIKVSICGLWWLKVVWTVSVTVVSNNAHGPSMVWVVSTTERCLLAKVLTALIVLIVVITNRGKCNPHGLKIPSKCQIRQLKNNSWIMKLYGCSFQAPYCLTWT